MKKRKPKKCPQCEGKGIVIDHLRGNLTPDERKIVVSDIAYTLCSRCRGVGIIGIPELEALSQQQLNNLVKGKSFEELFGLLNNKSPQELADIISEFSQNK